MELRDWCWKDMGRYLAVAKATERSVVSVRSWCKGTRRVPSRLSLMKAIEDLTHNEVTRHEMRSDVYGPPPGAVVPAPRRGRNAGVAVAAAG